MNYITQLASFNSKVRIHNLIESHNKIQDCRPPIAFRPGGKDINGGVATCSFDKSSNLKTKLVHVII